MTQSRATLRRFSRPRFVRLAVADFRHTFLHCTTVTWDNTARGSKYRPGYRPIKQISAVKGLALARDESRVHAHHRDGILIANSARRAYVSRIFFPVNISVMLFGQFARQLQYIACRYLRNVCGGVMHYAERERR